MTETREVKVGMKIQLECGHWNEYDYYNERFLHLTSHLCQYCPRTIKRRNGH